MQYAAAVVARMAAASGSMSRTANPYDNALAESFVATLKAECLADSIPPTCAAAELMAFDSIETFCNPHRRHSSLGQRSPRDFESQMFPHQPKPHQTPVLVFEEKSIARGCEAAAAICRGSHAAGGIRATPRAQPA
ncbi:MAG: integrase core domain-containing protein, partial [Chthoniobacteraceae bacterium]